MSTPAQLADDIDNAVAHSIEVDGSLDVAIDKALSAMRHAADALAAGAQALHTARLAHNRQANQIRSDHADTANIIRDLNTDTEQ
jgi:hypothetical protein